MPKGERQKAGQQEQGTYNQANAWTSQFQNAVGGMLPGAQAQSSQAYGAASKGFQGAQGDTGAESAPQVAALRTGYGKMATTGGFTPEQEQAFIRQSTSGIPAAANVEQNKMAIDRARTGGYAPGGETAEIARHVGQDTATATTAARSNLAQIEAQNKLAGMGGLRDLESGIAGQKLAAAGGLANLYASEPGYVTALLRTLVSGEAVGTAGQNQATELMTQLSKEPSVLQSIWNDIVSGAGAAGGILTGLNAGGKH